GLHARGGIGDRETRRHAIAVARTGAAIDLGLEPSVGKPAHRHVASAVDLNGDLVLLRRPQTKPRAAIVENGGPRRQFMNERTHDLVWRMLRVNTALCAGVMMSSPSMSRSGVSGAELSSRSRVGSRGSGMRKG